MCNGASDVGQACLLLASGGSAAPSRTPAVAGLQADELAVCLCSTAPQQQWLCCQPLQDQSGNLLQQNLGGAHTQSPQDAAAAAAISQRVAAMRQHPCSCSAGRPWLPRQEVQQAAQAADRGQPGDGTEPRAVKEKKMWSKKARGSCSSGCCLGAQQMHRC